MGEVPPSLSLSFILSRNSDQIEKRIPGAQLVDISPPYLCYFIYSCTPTFPPTLPFLISLDAVRPVAASAGTIH